jgi:hypothetical protein
MPETRVAHSKRRLAISGEQASIFGSVRHALGPSCWGFALPHSLQHGNGINIPGRRKQTRNTPVFVVSPIQGADNAGFAQPGRACLVRAPVAVSAARERKAECGG